MEKSLWLFVFLCSALIEVQCLECYVCDNCPKVKLDEIQTCAPTTTIGPSTTKSSTTITDTAKLPTFSISTTSKPITILTTATSEATTISSTITTEGTTISAKATDAIASTTETRPTFTESDTSPITTFPTATIEPTDNPIISTENSLNTSEGTQISTSTSATTTMETETSTEPSITAAPSLTITITEAISSTTTSTKLPITLTEIVSKPAISSLTTSTTEPSTPYTNDLFVSTMADPIAIIKIESTTQNIPILSTQLTAEPLATFATEITTKMPVLSVANYPVSTADIIRPDKEKNEANNFRRMRSSSEGCACKDEPTCDCGTSPQRSKRYALRGLGLSKEGVKYVCVVDKYQINGTQVVKRGCAIKDEDEKTSCMKSGFGADCKICDTNQCNSAAIVQSSILLTFTVYFFSY